MSQNTEVEWRKEKLAQNFGHFSVKRTAIFSFSPPLFIRFVCMPMVYDVLRHFTRKCFCGGWIVGCKRTVIGQVAFIDLVSFIVDNYTAS